MPLDGCRCLIDWELEKESSEGEQQRRAAKESSKGEQQRRAVKKSSKEEQ